MEKQVLTIVCKINPTPDQVAKIEATLQAFSDACNYINHVVDPKITHNVTIQNQVYTDVREQFGLASNLAIQNSKGLIGVDLGRRNIAATSEGDSFSGKQITDIRDRYTRVRTSLQKKASEGTRSTRRRARQILQRLSGSERRFQSWVNHNVSKQIVVKAKELSCSIAIEDLTGIRERTNEQPRNKTERRRSNSWAFYQLRLFLDYKALGLGVEVIKVNPAYTSQTCHKCLHIHPVKGKSYRSGKIFKCGHCSWKGDADINGANVIKLLGLSVNQPGGSYLWCELRRKVEYFQLSLFDMVQGY